VIKAIAKTLIMFYRWVISPLFPPCCRFHPTCSAFMFEAIDRHGAFKGIVLGIRRLLSCHPWAKNKWNDPVPNRFTWGYVLGYKRRTKESSG